MLGKMRKGLAIFLVCVMLVTLVPVSAMAATVVETGTVGEGGAPWRLYSDGTLRVGAGTIEWDGLGSPWNTYREDVQRIVFTGPIIAGTSLQGLFIDLQKVTSIEGLGYFDTSNVTNMSSMFSSAASLTNLDVSGFDTSNVTNMSSMFNSATSLTNLDVSGFDTSNVTNMNRMFIGVSNLTSLDLSTWDTRNVTNMGEMFWGARALNQLALGEYFRFVGYVNLPTVPGGAYLREWRNVGTGTVDSPQGNLRFTSTELTSSTNAEIVADNTWVWYRRAADNEVVASGTVGIGGAPWRLYGNRTVVVDAGTIDWNAWGSPWDAYRDDILHIVFTGPIVAGTSLRSLFAHLHELTSIEGFGYLDTSNVTDMSGMFSGLTLASLDLSELDTSNVTDMSRMFRYSRGPINLDLSSWDTGNVTTMRDMFRYMTELTSLDLSGFDTRNVTDMSGMFIGPHWASPNRSELTNLDLSSFDTRNVTDMNSMFLNSCALTTLDLSHFNTHNVTDMSGMFSGMSSLISLDLSSFSTYNVIYMGMMFSGVSSLPSLDLSSFNTQNVTHMWGMFSGASSLISLDLSNFDTRNVTQMSSMFSNTSSLVNLDVSSFDTSRVTDMSAMFSGASSLESLNLSNFNTHNVRNLVLSGVFIRSNMYMIFYGTSSLQQLTLGENFRFGSQAAAGGPGSIVVGGPEAVDLPPVPENETFTGRWQNVGGGTSENPQGRHVFTSAELLSKFDGATMADTWVWQPRTATTPVDRTALQTAITAAEQRVQANYTPASWTPFAIALTSARAMLTNANATQTDISTATTALQNAMAALVALLPTPIYGTVGEGGAPWRLYSDGTVRVGAGTIDWDGLGSPWNTYREDVQRIVFTGPIIAGTSLQRLFAGLQMVTSIEGLSYFDTSNVTNMNDMFAGAANLTNLDVSGFDTSNVTNMASMFTGASSLTSLDLSGWDTRNVASMGWLFANTSNLLSLDVSGWELNPGVIMWFMFADSGLTNLDLSSWNTSNVVSMSWLFARADALTSLDLSDWDIGNVRYMHGMFSGTNQLRQLTLGEEFAFVQLLDGNGTYHNADLPPAPQNETYTGYWQNVGTGTLINPQGEFVFTSEQLMANFNGPTMADTWVWQPRTATTPVDRTALQTAITAAELRVQANYTPASWTPFATALTSAQAMLTNANATQTEVNTATTALQNAMAALVAVPPPLDTTALQTAITAAEQRVQTNYTPASWTPFATALTNAQAMLTNAEATQTEINTATTALQNAMTTLVVAPPPLDTTALQTAVTAAEQRVQANYTPASWTAFAAALTSARAMLTNADATQAEINTATTALQNAMTALVAAPPPLDTTALQTAVTAAEQRVQVNYTPASWTAFAAALTSARAMLTNANATQAEINTATTSLQNAMTALVVAPPPLDTTALQTAITAAEQRVQSNYTPASWTPFATALTNAQTVLTNAEATQAQVNTAATTLQSTMEALIFVPVHSIALSTAENHTFPAAKVGYAAQPPHTVTVTNTGNVATGALTVTLEHARYFSLSTETIPSIPVGETATFTARPNTGLAIGTHTATVTVDGEDVTAQSFTVRFIVYPDRAALQTILDAATQRIQHNYTAESWLQLTTAKASAQTVLQNEHATGAQIANAIAALDFAKNILVLAPLPFTDVAGHWALANGSIEFVWRHGIMVGISDPLFAPEDTLTRAQVARILWNLEGQPETAFRPVFSDVLNVPTAEWYNSAVIWAYNNDIVRGIGGGRFAPHETVSRQEIATMLHRYAAWRELDIAVPTTFRLTNFPDHGQVTDWAEAGMRWAVYNEIIRGTDLGTLLPLGTAVRAECATIMQRFVSAE